MLVRLLKPLWTALVISVIVAAFLVSLSRILLPLVGHYRGDIEGWIYNVMGYPVEIGELESVWRGFSPTLKLANVQLRDPVNNNALFVFDQVAIELNVFESILTGRIAPGAVVLSGLKLTVVRTEQGELQLAGLVSTHGGGTGEPDPRLIKWMLSRRMLSLENARVVWHDQQRARGPVTFSDVNLMFSDTGHMYVVSGSGNLPAVFGRRLDFRGQFFGDLSRSDGWHGQTYLRAAGVRLGEWAKDLPYKKIQVRSGYVDTEIWSTWVNGQVYRIEGEASAFDVDMRNEFDEALALDAVSSHFRWDIDPATTDWRLALDRFTVAFDDHAWIPTSLGVERSQSANLPQWEVSAGQIVIADVLRFGEFIVGRERLPKQLKNLNPRGDAFDTYVRLRGDLTAPDFFVRTRLQNSSIDPYQKLPGITGFDAVVYAQNDKAFLALNSETAAVDFVHLFRQPLEASRLTGAVVAEKNTANEWTLWSDDLRVVNSDITLEAKLDLTLPHEGKPIVDLVAHFENGHGERAGTYYPVGIMKDNLVEWLDNAILGATVPSGGLILRGPLDKFPFINGEGRFEVRFDVLDGRLAYAPGWPIIENIDAQVVFSQQGMEIDGRSGISAGATLQKIKVKIADLKHDPILLVSGQGAGNAGSGWRYISESPLRKIAGELVASAAVKGQVHVDLGVSLPLHDHLPASINGKVTARNVDMRFPGDTPMDVSAINGYVKFSENGLTADRLTATVLGQPANIKIHTENGSVGNRALVFAADGSMSVGTLRRRLPLPVLSYADGATQWSGTLRVPPHGSAEAARLTIDTDLQGVTLNLPAPVEKSASSSRPTNLVLDFGGSDAWPLNFTYGADIRGKVTLAPRDGVWSVARGVIRYGENTGPLIDKNLDGLQIGARVTEIDLNDFIAMSAGGGEKAGAQKIPLSRVSIAADTLHLWGQSLKDVTLTAVNTPRSWVIDVNSDRALGQIIVPTDSEPITSNFAYLRLNTGAHDNAPPTASPKRDYDIDPRKLPAVEFYSDNFWLGDFAFGRAQGSLTKTPGGYKLNNGRLNNGPTTIRIDAAWTHDGTMATTQLNVNVESDDYGATLDQLGYSNTIYDGKGTTDLRLRWRGGPMDYEPSRLFGDIRFLINNGQVLEVNPGAGRVLGILSVQSLPRRLSLDFSDVFEKGFGFDKLDGQFTVRDGIATVNKFELRGPAAYIAIVGSLDLSEKTYDQRVKVIPNVSGNLPLVVGVLGTPVAGAAVWLAEKMFRKPIGDITQVNYRVTGPWSDPIVDRLSREALREEEKKSATGNGP